MRTLSRSLVIVLSGVVLACGSASVRQADLLAAAGDSVDLWSLELNIVETRDTATDTREWRMDRRYVEGGPRISLFNVPQFSVDIYVLSFGPGHSEAPGASGFMFRVYSSNPICGTSPCNTPLNDWTFLNARSIELIVDGSRIDLGDGEYDGRSHYEGSFPCVPRGTGSLAICGANVYRETLSAPILREELERVTNAQIVAVFVAGTIARLHPATLDAIRALLEAVPPTVK